MILIGILIVVRVSVRRWLLREHVHLNIVVCDVGRWLVFVSFSRNLLGPSHVFANDLLLLF